MQARAGVCPGVTHALCGLTPFRGFGWGSFVLGNRNGPGAFARCSDIMGMLKSHQHFHINPKRLLETDRHLGRQGDSLIDQAREGRATDMSTLAASVIVKPSGASTWRQMMPPGWGGFFIIRIPPLMIVHKIDVKSFLSFNSKNNSPIAANRYRPEAGETPFKAMNPKPGRVPIRVTCGAALMIARTSIIRITKFCGTPTRSPVS